MRKLSRITKFALLAVAGAGLLTLSAQASLTFNLDQTAPGAGGPAGLPGTSGTIFGTVNLTQGGNLNTVIVTVTLNSPCMFVNTPAGFSLGFDLSGNPAITISDLTPGYVAGCGGKASWTKDWQYDVDRIAAGRRQGKGGGGASDALSGPLVFTVYASGGLTPASFVANPAGYFFHADIIGPNGLTGNVAAIGAVPEPTTMVTGALLLLPFGASALRLLRKNRTA